jgi:thioredoxin reductase
MTMKTYDLVIVGAGPAGLFACLCAFQAGIRDILLIDRQPLTGGILTQCFHSGFGQSRYGKELTGIEYAQRLRNELEKTSIEIRLNTTALKIEPAKHPMSHAKSPQKCPIDKISPKQAGYSGKKTNGALVIASPEGGVEKMGFSACILATGCRERSIGSLPVYGTRPAGIFSAGSAQKMINLKGYYLGKCAVVLGSGDVGMIVSHHLSKNGTTVLGVIEQLNQVGGLARNKVRYLDANNIALLTNSTITKLYGDARLRGIEVCRVNNNKEPLAKSAYDIECDTLITSVGLMGERELLDEIKVELSYSDLPHERVSTNIPWLFVCGNALEVQRLVESVEQDGSLAAQKARDYLAGLGREAKLS